jgi:hypothetical protein
LGLGPKLLGYRDAAPCPHWKEYFVKPTTHDILWAPTSYRTDMPVLQPIQLILIKTFLFTLQKLQCVSPKKNFKIFLKLFKSVGDGRFSGI